MLSLTLCLCTQRDLHSERSSNTALCYHLQHSTTHCHTLATYCNTLLTSEKGAPLHETLASSTYTKRHTYTKRKDILILKRRWRMLSLSLHTRTFSTALHLQLQHTATHSNTLHHSADLPTQRSTSNKSGTSSRVYTYIYTRAQNTRGLFLHRQTCTHIKRDVTQARSLFTHVDLPTQHSTSNCNTLQHNGNTLHHTADLANSVPPATTTHWQHTGNTLATHWQHTADLPTQRSTSSKSGTSSRIRLVQSLKSQLPTEWRRVIGYLICMGHFLQKSPIISGSSAKNDKRLKASYKSAPLCCIFHTKRLLIFVSFLLPYILNFASNFSIHPFPHSPISLRYTSAKPSGRIQARSGNLGK